ncbi:hypothetical protein BABINDRAFT_35852 [Babjeviella inositovora NRRL Y-12698]|uniref:Uncharacterized protein n=1 Tax=Babjeviella inositovora NRRL Y-12698 TaxID=984486 RepID=A0A1E3QRA3_9ASCO|nr:uncharacterized protein BABINDRAFT_35852 [Babjeviella inositovora NRRL Y-12698]ODQ80225.1 hypothetical protein BABINDRAFT_35852 [Babjeviella inositovora NRRL Y-12698]
MPFVESPGVYAWSAGITLNTYIMQHLWLENLMDIHLYQANVLPLTETPNAYFVRRDRFDRQRKVNVFAGDGTKVYTIERKSALNPVWMMYTFPQRREVATIRAGLFMRAVDWHNKAGLEHRAITNDSGLAGRYRSFYLSDGAKYSWTRGTKCLEKVINPNGGTEEMRSRIAKVKLLRQFKMDFEVLVDEAQIDREVVLATAFISMLTQWGYGDITETTGPTFVGGSKQLAGATPEAVSLAVAAPEPAKVVLVIEGGDADTEYTIEPVLRTATGSAPVTAVS